MAVKRFITGVVTGAVAGVLLAGGVALATVPGADGKVWACYGNNEALRVFDKEAGETCRGTELALLGASGKAADSDMLDGLDSSAFYRTGSKAADADRLDGFDSTAFLRSVYRAEQAFLARANDASFHVVSCNPGDVAIAAGWHLRPTTTLQDSFPGPNGPATWGFVVVTGATQETVHFRVVCADQSP